MRSYTAEERAVYQPPPCPTCGRDDRMRVTWEDVSAAHMPHANKWVPASMACEACEAWRPKADCSHCLGTGQLVAGSQHNICHCSEL